MKSEKEQTFDQAVGAERDAFVMAINGQEWNNKMRTTAEDLLIMYDQMRERLNKVRSEESIRDNLIWMKQLLSNDKIDLTPYGGVNFVKAQIEILQWVLNEK